MSNIKTIGGAHGWCRALLLSCLVFAGLAAAPLSEAEAAGPSFTLQALEAPAQQSYFEFDADPAATVNGAVRVANEGDRAGVVRLYGVDATTGATTGAVYQERSEPRRSVGDWISLSESKLNLRPGESQTVSFEVEVPDNARAGHHLGGIVAENATLEEAGSQQSGGGSFEIDVKNLTIMAVQINLPGEQVELLELTSVEPGPAEGFQTLLIGMQNEGNQLLKGRGSMVVSDESGEQLKRGNFNVDTFVPETEIEYPFVVPGEALSSGSYQAEVKVRYGSGKLMELTTWFTISDGQIEQVFGSTPQAGPGESSSLLPLLIGALILLLLAALVAWLLRRRRSHQAPPSPTYVTAVHMPEGPDHEQIDFVQWQNPGTLAFGQSPREAIIEWISSGGDLRVRDPSGQELQVGVIDGDRPHIRTHTGGTWTNDLLSLPRY
ncbi:MAG TPA: DUF916 domain-containing protein [Solirubrobacterales bacterium]|nr:DUF916 domain-containing protein [Solirubrobacterales bacterium]